MTFLEHRIPPLVVLLFCAAAMWFLAKYTPSVQMPRLALVVAAIALLASGLLVMLAGVATFRRAKTTVNPSRPETASTLVTHGIYCYTRNPMYLGMLLLLIGWAAFLSSPAALLGAFAFWVYIDRFQIRPEERALAALFGKDYSDYTAKTRRWL